MKQNEKVEVYTQMLPRICVKSAHVYLNERLRIRDKGTAAAGNTEGSERHSMEMLIAFALRALSRDAVHFATPRRVTRLRADRQLPPYPLSLWQQQQRSRPTS